MIVIVGLVVVVAAVVAGVAGVLGNGGRVPAVTHFSVLGYHLTGSAGGVFLAGMVVGVAGLLGLGLLLAGARRTARRGRAARRGLKQSRRETAAVSQERDDLIGQRDTARTSTASPAGSPAGGRAAEPPLSHPGGRWGRLGDLRRRLAPAPTTTPSHSPARPAVPDIPMNPPATEDAPNIGKPIAVAAVNGAAVGEDSG
jgi:hypothetical protein